jgi:hypothetical protein
MQRLNTLIATTVAALAVVAMVLMPIDGARAASKEKVLFTSNDFGPSPGLIFDKSGNLYGTAGFGGANGYGDIFQLTRGANGKWSENVLYSFGSAPDAYGPETGVIFDEAGNLYGGTSFGGNGGCSWGSGCGTIFELMRGSNGQWSEKILYNFQGGSDGYGPNFGSLIFDKAGNLYGFAQGGTQGCGVVFELKRGAHGNWTEKVLYSFQCGQDGQSMGFSGIVFDRKGNLYGTTAIGGTGGCTDYFTSCGTVFEVSPSGNGKWIHKVLYKFKPDGKDGHVPWAGVVLDKAGNLYGTTYLGGPFNDSGTVFQLTRKVGGRWTEKVLHSFGNGTDGANPFGSLTLDAKGNLYGTTRGGGGYKFSCPQVVGCGTAFKLTPGANGKWTEEVLHRFQADGKDTIDPVGYLIFDKAGNLYGVSGLEGIGQINAVFELTP